MSRIIRGLSSGLFAVVVAAALSFGAAEALGGSPATEPCGDDPWEFGTCASQSECDMICFQETGGPGMCRDDGCCVCAI